MFPAVGRRVAMLCLLALLGTMIATKPAWTAPLGPHCGGVGPLPLPEDDPTICGCTWGGIYYRGAPIILPSTLTFAGQQTPAAFDASGQQEPFPFYRASGYYFDVPAKRGDLMQVSTSFTGTPLERTFRAWPEQSGDNQGEQYVPLVIPERGTWEPWLTGGYTRTLLVDGGTLWAGGPAGLLAIELATGHQTVMALPWPDPAVVALTIAPDGTRWVAGPHQLARWDGTQWVNAPVPFAATIRALAIDPTRGTLWVGGGDNQGALARYDGAWQTATGIWKTVTTLTFAHAPNAAVAAQIPGVAATSELWVGTFGNGVYRQNGDLLEPNGTWTRYTVADGLASDYIRTATSDQQTIWFGTSSYLGPQGYMGGISRYTLATSSWQQYAIAHGLPAKANNFQQPADIYALALDEAGTLWSGTASGIQLLAGAATWITDTATTSTVYALATAGMTVVAATQDGVLHRLDRSIIPGQPPTVTITSVDNRALTTVDTLALQATARDHDEAATVSAPQILAWDWASDVDGPLCTTAAQCSLPAAALSAGTHHITVRVQDDEGVWSAAATTTITIAEGTTAPTATPTAIPTATPVTPQPTVTPAPTMTPAPTVTPARLYLPVVQQ